MTASDEENSSSAAELQREILELLQEILDDTVRGREDREQARADLEQARAAMARTLNHLNRDDIAVERFREAVDRRLNPHLYS